MSSLLFVSGQIAALEDKLLKQGQLDRMIGASTPDEAFAVMAELSYAQYFDDSLRARDFASVIERGLMETKSLLVNGTDDHSVLGLIWWKFDVNNIKRAIKERFIDQSTEVSEFVEDNGYSPLGSLSKDQIQDLVFKEIPIKSFPESIQSFALEVNEADFDIYSVELLLDKAYFAAVKKVAKERSVKQYHQLMVDGFNVRALARSVLVFEKPLESDIWADGGSLNFHRFAEVETIDQLKDILAKTPFGLALSSSIETASGEGLLLKVEQIVDQYTYEWLKELSLGNDSILRVLYYFEQRLQNARMLKTVMLGKFYGLEVGAIQEKLKHIGH